MVAIHALAQTAASRIFFQDPSCTESVLYYTLAVLQLLLFLIRFGFQTQVFIPLL